VAKQQGDCLYSFFVGVLTAIAATYQTFSPFAESFIDAQPEISAFNESVQPVYFAGRSADIAPGQIEYLSRLATTIIKTKPRAIILHAHTSRSTPANNYPLATMRGRQLGNTLVHLLACHYDGEIIVVPRGGLSLGDENVGYAERIDIELSDSVEGVVGITIPIKC